MSILKKPVSFTGMTDEEIKAIPLTQLTEHEFQWLKQQAQEKQKEESKAILFGKKMFVVYKGDIYHNNNGVWINVNKTYIKQDLITNYIKGVIRNVLAITKTSELNNTYSEFMMDAVTKALVTDKDIDKNISVFKNGYYDLNQKKFIETDVLPFSLNQKTYEWSETAKSDVGERFIKALADKDEDKRQLILEIIGSCFFPQNPSIFAILHSAHSTSGKGTIIDWIRAATGSVRELDYKNILEGSNQFSTGALKGTDAVFFDELPAIFTKGTSETIKRIADSKEMMEVELKGVDRQMVINSATVVATTNKNVSFYDFDDALAKRVVFISLGLNKSGKYEFTPAEINELLNDPQSIQMLARLAINAFQSVFDSSEIRNQRFSLTQEHHDWIESKKINNNANVEEVISKSRELSDAIQGQEDFITNDMLANAYALSGISFQEKHYTARIFKNDFIDFLTKQKHNVREVSKTIKGKTFRGIEINWYKENN